MRVISIKDFHPKIRIITQMLQYENKVSPILSCYYIILYYIMLYHAANPSPQFEIEMVAIASASCIVYHQLSSFSIRVEMK